MLLKSTHAQKRIKSTGIGKPQRTAGGMVRLTSGFMTLTPKNHRKVIKIASKRPAAIHRTPTAVKRERVPVDPCENSNDSGLGFDHHLDYHTTLAPHSALHYSDKQTAWQTDEPPEVKRRRLEIKLESDDANDNFTFPETVRRQVPQAIRVHERSRVVVPVGPLTLTSQLSSTSRNGLTQLLIACQPEQQHRARYQTEGSRGAVKDRTGNGFPVVKLVGYDRVATLQVFIGTDQGRVAPHMFYQACRVSGKNSTPCVEKKVDGTIVIEVDVEPSKEMVVTCDCVGILKERNVDVEHRFPEEGSGRSKKKSTRCRMVFRTTISHPDGSQETLQATSHPIVCTQPPGVPEICKKSLSSCNVRGGQELFILGKNFLKDTQVVFQEGEVNGPTWSQSVQPDKEFLQQTHLVCVVPAYKLTDITEPVSVRLVVESSGKASEPHTFMYLPDPSVLVPEGNIVNNTVITQGSGVFASHLTVAAPLLVPTEPVVPFMATQTSPGKEEKLQPVILWEKSVDMMMPPPALPITARRSSVQMIVPDFTSPEELKQEIPESMVDPPKAMANVSDLSNTQPPSMDTFHRFVSNSSLPSINVSSYLSNIEGSGIYANNKIKSQVVSDVPHIVIPTTTSINKPIFSGDSSNLLTTVEPVLANQSSSITFDSRNLPLNPSSSQLPQENVSVIVSSSLIQKEAPDSQITQEIQQLKQLSGSTTDGINLLLTSSMNKQADERLDDFVNSAAESHISPNPTPSISLASVITDNSVLNSPNNTITDSVSSVHKMQETNITQVMQAPSLTISPHTSPHHVTASINDGSLCALMNTSSQISSNQLQTDPSIQASIDHHLSAAQATIHNLMQSPPQVSSSEVQAFSDLQTSLGQQLTSQVINASQMSHTDISNLMQSSQQPLQQPIDSSQINHSSLNSLIQSSQTASNQDQSLSNLQVTLEQKLSPQSISPSHIHHPHLNSLIQTSTQGPLNGTQTLSSLEASLEQHLSSQTVTSTQMIHPESLQTSSLSLNMSGMIGSSTQPTANEVQALNNLQASLEQQFSSQVMNHDSLTNGSIALNTSVATSPQIQAAVSQAQALSNFQASFEHHLESQVLNPPQPVLDSLTTNVHSPNSLNPSSIENSLQVAVSQAQNLSDLQLSFRISNHESVACRSLPLKNSIQNSSQNQIVVSEAQVFSNLQASLEHCHTSQVMGATQRSSDTLMPLESVNDSVQNCHQQSNQSLPSLQESINHLSSQVIASPPTNNSETLTANDISISNQQTLDLTTPMPLINSQQISVGSNSSTSGPVLLSPPTSHHSPPSILTSSGIPLSSTPSVVLSSASLSVHNAQPVELNATNMVLSTSDTLLHPELSMNNSSTLRMTEGTPLPSNSISQFNQVVPNMQTQSLPDELSVRPHYDQHQCTNKDSERKDTAPYMISTETPVVQTQTNFEMKPQTLTQTVKKCEEGMPLPHELTQMSEHDLIRYINPSCFDTV